VQLDVDAAVRGLQLHVALLLLDSLQVVIPLPRLARGRGRVRGRGRGRVRGSVRVEG